MLRVRRREHVYCRCRYITICIGILWRKIFFFFFLSYHCPYYYILRQEICFRFIFYVLLFIHHALFAVRIFFSVSTSFTTDNYYSTRRRRHCVSPSLMTFIYNLDSRHARRMIRGSVAVVVVAVVVVAAAVTGC